MLFMAPYANLHSFNCIEITHNLCVVGDMAASDRIMMNTLFLGTYPGLTQEMQNKVIQVIADFVQN